MLSLGREILAEPNTSSASDGLMQKLTGFIQDWSDLQLNWQNWFDELHAGVEQSKNLSDQFKKFESDMRGLAPALAKLFPATVAVKTLDKDLQRVQVHMLHRSQDVYCICMQNVCACACVCAFAYLCNCTCE